LGVRGAAQREVDHDAGNGAVAHAVDQHKAAEFARVDVGLEGDHTVQRQVDRRDFVEVEAPARGVLQRVDVDLVLDRGHLCRGRLRAESEKVAAPREQRFRVHPCQVCLELIGDIAWRVGRAEDVGAGNVDGVGQGQRHRLAGHRLAPVAVSRDDAGNARHRAGRLDDHAVADAHRAACDSAGVSAEIRIGPIDPLDR